MKKFLFLFFLCASACFGQLPMGGVTGASGGGSYTLAYDNKGGPTSNYCPNSTTCTWTQTVGAAAHPAFFVWTSLENSIVNASITSITLTAGTMTLLGHANANGTYGQDTYLYYYVGSSLSSTTQTVTITYSVSSGSTTTFTAGSFSLTGVNQSSPFDGSAVTTSEAASVTGISQNITLAASGEWVIDAVYGGSQGTSSSDGIVPNSPQTLVNKGSTQYDYQGGSSYNSTGTSGTVSDGWTSPVSITNMCLVTAAVKPG